MSEEDVNKTLETARDLHAKVLRQMEILIQENARLRLERDEILDLAREAAEGWRDQAAMHDPQQDVVAARLAECQTTAESSSLPSRPQVCPHDGAECLRRCGTTCVRKAFGHADAPRDGFPVPLDAPVPTPGPNFVPPLAWYTCGACGKGQWVHVFDVTGCSDCRSGELLFSHWKTSGPGR